MIKDILKNPISIWLRSLVKNKKLEWKYRVKNNRIGYLTDCSKVIFGHCNKIYHYVRLTDVQLGDYTYVASHSTVVKSKIGKFSSIGPNCRIGLPKHPAADYVSTHPIFYSTAKQAQISFADQDYFDEKSEYTEIGNDVWIGANVIIMGGVKIGDGAIIGAGAIVTKNVSPYAVVGGVPAKVIRYRFSQDQIDFLLNFCWWDKDIQWLKSHYKLFHHIDELVSFVEK
jgi:acetyltransferase-like isoleucine patch superfamily enzyme